MDFYGVADWEETVREYERLWDRAIRVVPPADAEAEVEEVAA